MKAAAAGNQGVMEVKTKLLGSFAIVAAFAAVLTLGEGTAQAATCSVPSISYPTIQEELSHSLLNLAERDGRASYPQFTARRRAPI